MLTTLHGSNHKQNKTETENGKCETKRPCGTECAMKKRLEVNNEPMSIPWNGNE